MWILQRISAFCLVVDKSILNGIYLILMHIIKFLKNLEFPKGSTKVMKKARNRSQYSQVPHLTPNYTGVAFMSIPQRIPGHWSLIVSKWICNTYFISIIHIDGVCDKISCAHCNPVHGQSILTTKSYIKLTWHVLYLEILSFTTKVWYYISLFFPYLHCYGTWFVKIKYIKFYIFII